MLHLLRTLNDWLAGWLAPVGDFDHFCALVGLLFLLDLLAYLPLFEVFFGLSEDSGFQTRRRGRTLGLGLGWLVAALALMSGQRVCMLAATLFFYCTYRFFYIDRRWSSIRRGGGAPGFMSHWTAFYLLLLQAAAFLDASGALPRWLGSMARIDLGVIMICAGVYKYMIGYLKNDGMEYGRVNPMWGYAWRRYRHRDPAGFHETVSNILGSVVEIGAGLCLLSSHLQVLGAVAISLSFLLVGLLIRLGRLAWLMTLLPALCLPNFGPTLMARVPFHLPTPTWLLAGLTGLSWAFLALLPLVKFTQYFNLFANRSLPQPLQSWLTRYANSVPIIIWRVFTPDVTNFYVRIFAIEGQQERAILTERDYTLHGWTNLWQKLRFWHVTESITLTSIFTTLKYFPSNRELFDQKLLRYADSLAEGRPTPVRFRFEYVSIQKLPPREIAMLPPELVYDDRPELGPNSATRFAFLHVGNFYVNRDNRRVREQKLLQSFDFAAPSRFSPVRESAAPGSYQPRV